MKLIIRKSWTSSLRLAAVFTVLFAQAPSARAQEPRLTVESGRRAEGYVAEMVQGNSGEVVISGEFEAPRHSGFERIPAITVLDQAGRVRQRLAPPSLSAVRAVLPQGGYIVTDNVGFPPQRVLTPDGAFDYLWEDRGFPSLTGQIAAHRNQGVLMARNPWDPDRFAAIERVDFQHQPSAYDPSFGSNVFNTWPVRGLICARMEVCNDGHVWAWLDDGKVSRLFRFLPDGRPDPMFKPSRAIESVTLRFNSEPFLGPVPDGSVIINATDGKGGISWQRLRADGRDDPDFDLSGFSELLDSARPLLPLADGSMLAMKFLRSDDGAHSWVDLLRIAANGRPDLTWHPAMPLWWKLNAWPDVSRALLQADGKILMVLNGFRFYEMARFSPDGSSDPTFDPSIVSPTPNRVVRLSFSGVHSGRVYRLESSSSPSGGEWQPVQEFLGGLASQPGTQPWGWVTSLPESAQFWRLREPEEPR